MTTATSTTERREILAAAVAAVRGLIAEPFRSTDSEITGTLADVAELRALCDALLVEHTAEAESRGIVEDSQFASTRAWLADTAWHARRDASRIAAAARIVRRPEMSRVTEAIREAVLDPATAVVVAREFDSLAPNLRPDCRPVVLDQLANVGAENGPAEVRRLKQIVLENYGDQDAFEDHQDVCRRSISLSNGVETSAGVWKFDFITDNVGRAALEAAIGPGSAPRPDKDTGKPDHRPTDRRRGEALIAVLRRAQVAMSAVPTSAKATLVVTMGWEQLRDQLGAGTALGTRAAGVPLSPATVRRIACDAKILPAVLGSNSELLNLGKPIRLFTPRQVGALWIRDQHCTFDGCDAPAAWCDAHHLTHWADGGPTDLDNAALLCGRHHQIVHRDRLHGSLENGHVVWDRRPNSYRPVVRPPSAVPPKRLPAQRGVVVRR